MTGTPLAAAVFCQNLEANCPGLPAEYAAAMCAGTYGAVSATKQSCQSYHLCWGVEGKFSGPALPGTHCPHATGGGPCQNP